MVRKIAGYLLIAIVVLAVWRGSGGNIDGLIGSIWGFIEAGAEFVRKIWDALIPVANDAVNNTGTTPDPSPSPSAG